MKIQFHGAARTVTGSCHLVEVGTSRILLDCGLFQGHRKEAFERNRSFAFDPSSIDAVVLSHAHIDHSGNLPTLVLRGFTGRIHATRATQDLCGWMLRDSAHIQERDVVYVNKKRRRKKQKPFEPLYTLADAERALTHFQGARYDREIEVAPGIRVTFRDAGHILGSASCELRIDDRGRERVLLFTGDIGRPNRPILRDPVPPRRADILISESTYGDRLHGPPEDVERHLERVVRETFDRGGKVLIPAFSVGRTQRVVYHLHDLFRSGRLPPVPIFVDSPLSANVTEVFRAHPECFDEEMLEQIENHGDPLGFRRLTYIRDVEASKALNELHIPCVIIAASGMCEAGRVLHHLKRIAPDKRNTILVVGFMAEHTLGRRIAERAPVIKVYGEEYPLEAHVESISGLSAHGDRDEILAFLGKLERPPERTFLVHGEEHAAEALAGELGARGFREIAIPKRQEKFKL